MVAMLHVEHYLRHMGMDPREPIDISRLPKNIVLPECHSHNTR